MLKKFKSIAAVIAMLTLCSCMDSVEMIDPALNYIEEQEEPTSPPTVIFSGIPEVFGKANDDTVTETADLSESTEKEEKTQESQEDKPREENADNVENVENIELPKPDYKAAGCIEVPYRSQDDFPTGCELVSTSMLLGYYGFEVEPGELIEGGYVITSELEKEDGTVYGGDPNFCYVGDPRKKTGFGCYSGAIFDGLGRFLENEFYDTYYLTGMSLNDICTQYIDFGEPVLIWGSIGMEQLYYRDDTKWTIRESGEEFRWLSNEHCMVLVGYDDNYYYIHDPLKGQYTPYERELVDMRFSEMGSQAVTIIPW